MDLLSGSLFELDVVLCGCPNESEKKDIPLQLKSDSIFDREIQIRKVNLEYSRFKSHDPTYILLNPLSISMLLSYEYLELHSVSKSKSICTSFRIISRNNGDIKPAFVLKLSNQTQPVNYHLIFTTFIQIQKGMPLVSSRRKRQSILAQFHSVKGCFVKYGHNFKQLLKGRPEI